ncbi:hypothetical protein [Lachnospira multipara]|uniref:hypothetical protein n=1 Tax=Lachnospira multipara TaxID=28051 RepID=UPI000486EAC8|nr:hypothetical protein [Lachnospira multipara]
MDLTRKWLNDKTDVSQKLYNLLDDEECSLTLYQESEKDECVIEVWNCIIDKDYLDFKVHIVKSK